jgi:osmotically-inducible protein OsmY
MHDMIGFRCSSTHAPARRRDRSFSPRNVWRPDRRIHEDLGERLARMPHAEAAKVRFRVTQGEVTLLGDDLDPGLSRLAEHTALSTCGVQLVHNEIRVAGTPQQIH